MARKVTTTPARSTRGNRNGTTSCPPAARSTAPSTIRRQPPAPGAQTARSTVPSTARRQPPASGAQPIALHGSGDVVATLAEDLSNRHTLTKLKCLYADLNGKPTRLTSKAGVSRAVALTIATARRTAPLIKEGEIIAELAERPYTWPPPDNVRAVRMSIVEAARGSGNSNAGRIMAMIHDARGGAPPRFAKSATACDGANVWCLPVNYTGSNEDIISAAIAQKRGAPCQRVHMHNVVQYAARINMQAPYICADLPSVLAVARSAESAQTEWDQMGRRRGYSEGR